MSEVSGGSLTCCSAVRTTYVLRKTARLGWQGADGGIVADIETASRSSPSITKMAGSRVRQRAEPRYDLRNGNGRGLLLATYRTYLARLETRDTRPHPSHAIGYAWAICIPLQSSSIEHSGAGQVFVSLESSTVGSNSSPHGAVRTVWLGSRRSAARSSHI